MSADAERQRLDEDEWRVRNWRRWGPPISPNASGELSARTTRNTAPAGRTFLTTMLAARRTGGEKTDSSALQTASVSVCFALALWKWPRPHPEKERLFGLTNEGKPEKTSRSCITPRCDAGRFFTRALYKYPLSRRFVFAAGRREPGARSPARRAFEVDDTGVFDHRRYVDVFVEYAKADVDDILIRITCANRGDEDATLHVLPTLWLRNTWSWGDTAKGGWARGVIARDERGRCDASSRHWERTASTATWLAMSNPGVAVH